MRLTAVLALAALLVPSARAAEAPAAPGPDVLLVDFVEYGRAGRSVSRDVAMVDLINMSGHVLDVVIGEGSATLQPNETIIARVKIGDQDITVSSRESGIPPVDGKLHLDAGVRYQLALGYGPAPVPQPEEPAPAAPSGAKPGEPQIAPAPGTAAAPAAEGTKAQPAKKQPPRTKGGKVDVGRRR